MKGNVKWGVAGLVLGLAAALAIPSLAQTSPPPTPGSSGRTVTVSGTATIRSAPDEAVVSLGVQTQAPTAQQALQDNARKMTDVMKALLGAGLKQSDIATTNVSLYPNYNSDGTAVISFVAENDIQATVHDMGKVGSVIDTAVAAGANVTSGISFQLSDQNQGLDRALQAAVADARSKAETLAAAGGATLGQVISITETAAPNPPPIMYEKAAAAPSTPVSPPTLETQVSVTVVWALS